MIINTTNFIICRVRYSAVKLQNLKSLAYTEFVYGFYDGQTDREQRKIGFRQMDDT